MVVPARPADLTKFTWTSPSLEVREDICVGVTGEASRPRAYEDAAIGFMLKGGFEYRVGSRAMLCGPGGVILGNRGEDFSVRHFDESANKRLVTTFPSALIEEVAAAAERGAHQFSVWHIPPGQIASRMFGWMRRLSLQYVTADEASCAMLSEIWNFERPDSPDRQPSARDRQRVDRAVRHIVAHYEEPQSLQDLAELVGLSRFQFLRIFQAVVGQSPNQFVIGVRLRAAAERLLTTGDLITQVALDVGFNDISHFTTCFKTTFNCTPRQWRRRSRS